MAKAPRSSGRAGIPLANNSQAAALRSAPTLRGALVRVGAAISAAGTKKTTAVNKEPEPEISPVHRVSVAGRTVKNKTWKSGDFTDFNAHQSTFEGCDFRYAIFTRAYLRKATFINCRFDGARFIDCNLRDARFLQSTSQYVTFTRCLLEPQEVTGSLPPYPNVRQEVLRSLKANAMETGDYASVKMIVLQEVEASKSHFLHAATGYDSHYKQKYASVGQRAKAAIQFAGLKVDQWVWGHGERPWQLLLSASVALTSLALVNFWAVLPRQPWPETQFGFEILKYVVRTFLDMPSNDTFRGFEAVDFIIVVMRYIYIGLFVSVLYKSISRR